LSIRAPVVGAAPAIWVKTILLSVPFVPPETTKLPVAPAPRATRFENVRPLVPPLLVDCSVPAPPLNVSAAMPWVLPAVEAM
jgi:hypothetical protein